jgi:nitrogen fixation protein NifU and related proteins
MAKKINSCACLYTPKIMAHFKNPHNYGSIKNPDGVGQVGNPVCGDVMKLYIKVAEDKKGRKIIKDIKFQTYGCVAAIATSSVVTDLAKGKTLEQALKIDNKKIVASLGGLPNLKLHCSVLGADALKEAIKDYLSKNGKE